MKAVEDLGADHLEVFHPRAGEVILPSRVDESVNLLMKFFKILREGDDRALVALGAIGREGTLLENTLIESGRVEGVAHLCEQLL